MADGRNSVESTLRGESAGLERVDESPSQRTSTHRGSRRRERGRGEIIHSAELEAELIIRRADIRAKRIILNAERYYSGVMAQSLQHVRRISAEIEDLLVAKLQLRKEIHKLRDGELFSTSEESNDMEVER